MLEITPKTPVLQRKGQLKYEQLKRMVLDQMASGRLMPGDLLPPEVELAHKMGVARNTVRQAMRELELQRVIRRVRGKGTIVCEVGPPTETPAPTTGQLFGLTLPELRAGMYQALQAGFNTSMSATGANMIVCDIAQDLHLQVDALLQLAHRGVSGIAMVPISSAKTPVHHVSILRQNRIPLVFCHRRVEGIRAPLVGFSPFDMGYVAGKELARQGHRSIAMVFSHRSDSAEERKRGVRAAMREVGSSVLEEFIYFDNSFRADQLPPGLEERLIAQLKTMLAHPTPPTGIVVSADGLAAMVCMAIQKLGLRVPEDLSVIGFGDRWNRNMVLPVKLQSVTVDEWKLGQIAYETLGQIQRGERPIDDNEEIMMPLEISDGNTICPPQTK